MSSASPPPFSRSLLLFALLYGGMTCVAGVLGAKQVALGPLAVEGGIFPFLLLVVLSSTTAELHGRRAAEMLVRFGFVPLLTAMALIWLVIRLPYDPAMYPPAITAFPVILGQSARMMMAGVIAYGVSQSLNVLLFTKLSQRAGTGAGRGLGMRGAVASALSQIVDTVLFISLSFLGERSIGALMAGQMLAKVLLSLLLVPPLIHLLAAIGRRIDGVSKA
ncbi:MAG TPA: queuosine precursor transporter [Sphingobium sp.]|uniref:queuosine precursor transporter n=1 Tax=Sphingobium sp. TaxID=1912891 RepID=UPI002ED49D7F